MCLDWVFGHEFNGLGIDLNIFFEKSLRRNKLYELSWIKFHYSILKLGLEYLNNENNQRLFSHLEKSNAKRKEEKYYNSKLFIYQLKVEKTFYR